MRYQQRGQVVLALQTAHQNAHFFAQLRVERSKWFIKQQHTWLRDECPRQCHPLALPAAQLVWAAARKAIELHCL